MEFDPGQSAFLSNGYSITTLTHTIAGIDMSTKDTLKENYTSVIESLKKERDELNLKMHLAAMEVRDEWDSVEEKWQHFQSKGHQLSQATGESAHELGEAFSILGDELKETYRRLKNSV